MIHIANLAQLLYRFQKIRAPRDEEPLFVIVCFAIIQHGA